MTNKENQDTIHIQNETSEENTIFLDSQPETLDATSANESIAKNSPTNTVKIEKPIPSTQKSNKSLASSATVQIKRTNKIKKNVADKNSISEQTVQLERGSDPKTIAIPKNKKDKKETVKLAKIVEKTTVIPKSKPAKTSSEKTEPLAKEEPKPSKNKKEKTTVIPKTDKDVPVDNTIPIKKVTPPVKGKKTQLPEKTTKIERDDEVTPKKEIQKETIKVQAAVSPIDIILQLVSVACIIALFII